MANWNNTVTDCGIKRIETFHKENEDAVIFIYFYFPSLIIVSQYDKGNIIYITIIILKITNVTKYPRVQKDRKFDGIHNVVLR
jgi:hypothetical protein